MNLHLSTFFLWDSMSCSDRLVFFFWSVSIPIPSRKNDIIYNSALPIGCTLGCATLDIRLQKSGHIYIYIYLFLFLLILLYSFIFSYYCNNITNFYVNVCLCLYAFVRRSRGCDCAVVCSRRFEPKLIFSSLHSRQTWSIEPCRCPSQITRLLASNSVYTCVRLYKYIISSISFTIPDKVSSLLVKLCLHIYIRYGRGAKKNMMKQTSNQNPYI